MARRSIAEHQRPTAEPTVEPVSGRPDYVTQHEDWHRWFSRTQACAASGPVRRCYLPRESGSDRCALHAETLP